MAEQNTISGVVRDRVGKGRARALRREGRLPAVVYGAKQDPLSISLDPARRQQGFGRWKFLFHSLRN